MRQDVTVIPGDRIIIVDGAPLWFAFEAPANLHALQWHDGAGGDGSGRTISITR